jgi:hypothetical protein
MWPLSQGSALINTSGTWNGAYITRQIFHSKLFPLRQAPRDELSCQCHVMSYEVMLQFCHTIRVCYSLVLSANLKSTDIFTVIFYEVMLPVLTAQVLIATCCVRAE